MRDNHCDMTGSVLLQTDDSGAPAGGSSTTASYTAFGEPAYAGALDNFESRYRYCGGFGYESGVQTDLPEGDEWASYFGAMGGMLRLAGASGTQPIDLVHVGYRWYQPNIGRFIQRDPLGIQGGLNVYVYCGNNPLSHIDAYGLFDYDAAAGGCVTGATTGAALGMFFAPVCPLAPLMGAMGGAILGWALAGRSGHGLQNGMDCGVAGVLGAATGFCVAAPKLPIGFKKGRGGTSILSFLASMFKSFGITLTGNSDADNVIEAGLTGFGVGSGVRALSPEDFQLIRD